MHRLQNEPLSHRLRHAKRSDGVWQTPITHANSVSELKKPSPDVDAWRRKAQKAEVCAGVGAKAPLCSEYSRVGAVLATFEVRRSILVRWFACPTGHLACHV